MYGRELVAYLEFWLVRVEQSEVRAAKLKARSLNLPR